MWNTASNDTPVLRNFLESIRGLIQSRDGAKLQDYLQIEPPLSPVYTQMVAELRQKYPSNKDGGLLSVCEGVLSGNGPGSSWSAFPLFLRLYFTFLRDVNIDNLLETYELLRTLLKYVYARSL